MIGGTYLSGAGGLLTGYEYVSGLICSIPPEVRYIFTQSVCGAVPLVVGLIGFESTTREGVSPVPVVSRLRGHRVNLLGKTNLFPYRAHFIILPYSQIFDDLDCTWPALIEGG